MRLILNPVPARQGQRWVAQGWEVFRHSPLSYSALLATYLVAWMVFSLVGVIGSALMLAALPLLSLVFMIAAHNGLQKRPVGLSVWAQPFKLNRQRTQAQIQLALLYLLATVLLMLLAHAVDGGALDQLQDAMAAAGKGGEESSRAAEAAMQAAISDPAFLWGVAFRLIGATLISIPFWHAPALVHWGGHGPLKALFSSVMGIWTNRAAFVVNGLVWIAVLLAASMVLAILMMLLGVPAIGSALLMPFVLLMSTVFYCGLYFTFVDCFRFVADDPKPSSNPDATDERGPALPLDGQ
ncbi:MAG: BPSS1780 family membrane protein [Burkholderiales bacterium]